MLFAFLLSTLDCFSLRWVFFHISRLSNFRSLSQTLEIFHCTECLEVNLSSSALHNKIHICDDDVMLKETKKGDQEMPAHSTMCIWHIGLACLDLPQPLRIKNSVYVHNSRSYHTNFLPLIPSHSYNFPRFSHFAWCEMREDWSWGWVENERMEGKKWENAATRNIQNNVYFNVFCLPMSPCSLTLSLSLSQWLRNEMYIRDKLVIRFSRAAAAVAVEMWVYGKDALCVV